ncbi:YopJ family acetyltransferase [Xenorhabdus lircayensis]|uniref:Uncharacterized protein n=1 Tax=Xenorhabdus lircayensis TaxID=2763499 RepID=A0ABS0U4W6_9GAMM|nr:YopJ family acetyltransferase [Xenorhabdus lircayensis]MBI6548929.1 hypothetical protein [Xenorhabdus lircayensis]
MNGEFLNKYIKEIKSKTENNSQFSNITLDQLSSEIILRYFNRKYPNMNACNTIIDIDDFVKYEFNSLTIFPPNSHKRYIIKTTSGGQGVHFATANVFKDKENNTSIIFVDSSLGENPFIPFKWKINRDKSKNENENEKKLKILYIYSQIQYSPGDCLLFGLHFLKKMHKHAQYFRQIHQDIFNDEIHFNNEDNKDFTPKTNKLPDDECEKYRTVFFNQAINLLPIDFFKHAQSIKPINAYLARHPDETNKKVNKWQGGETLKDRYQRHTVTRTINGIERTYSNSIEEKRLSLAEAALRWLDEHGE